MRPTTKTITKVIIIACAISPLGVVEGDEPYFRSPSVADIASVPYVTDFSVSPDGRDLAYVTNNAIFTARLSAGASTVRRAEGTHPRWSPDSHTLAFYCMSEEGGQLCLIDLQTGTIDRLTHIPGGLIRDAGIDTNGGSSLDFSWSGDSTSIIFATKATVSATSELIHSERDLAQPLVFSSQGNRDPLTRLPLVDGQPMLGTCDSKHSVENFSIGRRCGFTQLFIADVRTDAVRQVSGQLVDHFQPTWSADYKAVYCVTVKPTARSMLSMPSTQIVEVDLGTGIERVVVPGPESKIRPTTSPDHSMVAFEESGADRYIPWSLVVITKDGTQVLDTRKLIDRDIVNFVWSEDSKAIIVEIRDGVQQRLVYCRIADAKAINISLDTKWVADFDLGPDNLLAFIAEDWRTVNEVRLTADRGQHIQTILKITPETTEWDLGKQKTVHWRNSKGEDLEGVLLLPTNFDQHHSYPLIVDMRGSQSCQCFQRDRWDANQLLAQHGYAVFYPILRAVHTPFLFAMGDEFHRYRGALRGLNVMVDDVTTGVEELCRRGVARRGSIGLLGFSVGAYGALEMAMHSSLFNCIVASGAVYVDWPREYLLSSDIVDLQSRVGGKTFWDAPDLYRDLSIVYGLDRIKAATLLLVGDQDWSSIEENVEIYNGLRELGTPVTLVRYPHQGHQFSGANLEDYWRRIVEFCDSRLKNSVLQSGPLYPHNK
jgi:dipeptidyl aminopeptidase/acylaminoacyl peptidase